MRLDRSGYELEFVDDFDGTELDRTKWIPHYLPQWASRERTAAHYSISDGMLRLRIDADQKPWSPELNGPLRVSNLQTGVFSGPVGSTIGQHQFTPGLIVTEMQAEQRLYTPHFGIIEARVAAIADPASMVALWMIGVEDDPQRSAEICIFEIFGTDVGSSETVVGMGVHPFGDPTIRDEFLKVPVPIDAREFHTYSVEWTPTGVTFFVDEEFVASVAQSPDYPMQLMLNIYEFEAGADDAYPKQFLVDWVGGYRPRR